MNLCAWHTLCLQNMLEKDVGLYFYISWNETQNEAILNMAYEIQGLSKKKVSHEAVVLKIGLLQM